MERHVLGGRLLFRGAGKGRKSSLRTDGGVTFVGNRERGRGVPRRGGGVVHSGAGRTPPSSWQKTFIVLLLPVHPPTCL